MFSLGGIRFYPPFRPNPFWLLDFLFPFWFFAKDWYMEQQRLSGALPPFTFPQWWLMSYPLGTNPFWLSDFRCDDFWLFFANSRYKKQKRLHGWHWPFMSFLGELRRAPVRPSAFWLSDFLIFLWLGNVGNKGSLSDFGSLCCSLGGGDLGLTPLRLDPFWLFDFFDFLLFGFLLIHGTRRNKG